MIAEIEQLVEFESFFADGVFLYINLEFLAALLEVRESSFAHEANRHDASRDADIDTRLLEFLGGLCGVLRQDLLHGVGELVFAAVGGLAQSFNLLQFLAAQAIDMFVECQWLPLCAAVEWRL